jgi:hypothetical protein
MSECESFQVPAIIADVGPEAAKRFFEFSTVPQEFQIGFSKEILAQKVLIPPDPVKFTYPTVY